MRGEGKRAGEEGGGEWAGVGGRVTGPKENKCRWVRAKGRPRV